MEPYFKDRNLRGQLAVNGALHVTCGRCESLFQVILRKRKDYPTVVCPKCKVENRLNITWK